MHATGRAGRTSAPVVVIDSDASLDTGALAAYLARKRAVFRLDRADALPDMMAEVGPAAVFAQSHAAAVALDTALVTTRIVALALYEPETTEPQRYAGLTVPMLLMAPDNGNSDAACELWVWCRGSVLLTVDGRPASAGRAVLDFLDGNASSAP